MTDPSGHLCLLAGTGDLPGAIIQRASGSYTKVSRIDLADTDKKLLGDPKELVRRIAATGASHLVAAGGVTIGPDDRVVLAKWAGSVGRSQDVEMVGEAGDASAGTLLGLVALQSGVHLISPAMILRDWLPDPFPIAGEISKDLAALCRSAMAHARTIGATDLGQAIVCSGGRPIAAEGVEGTEGLLRRVNEYRRAGLIASGPELILAKAPRPGQSLVVDMPVIGPNTISQCVAAGVGTIVVAAGETLLIDRPNLIAVAVDAGIAILGVSVDA